jgi:hypothetical protein
VLIATRMYQRPRARRLAQRRSGGRVRVRPAALASLFIILGLLFAQLVQLSDLLLFQHSACEHGELVHGPLHGSSAATAASSEEAQRLLAAPSGHDDHEHCEAMAIRHRIADLAAHVPEATLLAGTDSPVLASGSPQRPIALLAVAPKASPPRG